MSAPVSIGSDTKQAFLKSPQREFGVRSSEFGVKYVYGDDEENDILPRDDYLKDFIDLDEAYQSKYNGCSISDLEQAIAQTGTLTMTAGDEV